MTQGMGAWGPGFFENDDAAEWVTELEETGFDAIQSALLVADEEEMEITEASQALAAAVVVLAMAGSSFKELPEEVEAWLEEHSERPEASLLERTLAAVQAVNEGSELGDYWQGTEDYPQWHRLMKSLLKKLESKVN